MGGVEVELDLLFRGERVDHVGDAADEVDGVEHHDGLRAVGHGDGDAVAGADAERFQALRAQLDVLHELFIGRALAHEVKGDVVGVLFRVAGHGVEHAALKIHIIVRHLQNVFVQKAIHLIMQILQQYVIFLVTHALPVLILLIMFV